MFGIIKKLFGSTTADAPVVPAAEVQAPPVTPEVKPEAAMKPSKARVSKPKAEGQKKPAVAAKTKKVVKK